jgi:ribosomal protein S18 acetylase RimI-like enzyme
VTVILKGFALEPDAWLGNIVGRSALRVVPTAGTAVLPERSFFATARVAADNVAAATMLEDAGFHVVDMALTFGARAETVALDRQGEARDAAPQDRADVARIARDGFRFSRFHLDPKIPRSLAGRIKAAWAENFFNGRRGDAMLLVEVDCVVAGFIQLLRSEPRRLVIDLIAVDEHYRRRGLADAMIAAAARRLGEGELVVGTQSANTAAVRLYESLGFRLMGAQFVLHHHGDQRPYDP